MEVEREIIFIKRRWFNRDFDKHFSQDLICSLHEHRHRSSANHYFCTRRLDATQSTYVAAGAKNILFMKKKFRSIAFFFGQQVFNTVARRRRAMKVKMAIQPNKLLNDCVYTIKLSLWISIYFFFHHCFDTCSLTFLRRPRFTFSPEIDTQLWYQFLRLAYLRVRAGYWCLPPIQIVRWNILPSLLSVDSFESAECCEGHSLHSNRVLSTQELQFAHSRE